ncbi:hypothetical protein [Microbacterium radiodurans]|uniref:DUF3558 domain-containing protein n=1 Tax=Microbacterium radiodurans TaxID=661398 RepID=A0A5J5ITU7_9MICO|nr:hypothetical protein [Microbacterium radiodurans]KAA9087318.1 hypothetical protein F6B42_10270 [Microbacterium radiodurans]
MSASPRIVIRFAPIVAAVALLTAGCATPAATAPEDSSVPTETATAEPTPTATPTPVETEALTDDIALPASCDDIYPADLRAQLEGDVPPLNDPGVTMYSTENADALTILESGVPTLRCTWGVPSDIGVATTVSLVSPEQASRIGDALSTAGFGSEAAAGGEIYRTSQQMLSMDEEVVELGETHFLRGNAWVATRWVNYGPEGYTPGIVSALWG